MDEYIKRVIGQGDEGSELLAKITAPTLKNTPFVQVLEHGKNGLAVLRSPKDYDIIVHSASGDPNLDDLAAHSSSLVDRLVEQANTIGASPVAFANVVDSYEGENPMLEVIGNALAKAADKYQLAIMNGENAILGARVNPDIQANVSGTMISLVPNNSTIAFKNMLNYQGVNYARFDPHGQAILINSDGIGTKTEFYERALLYHLGINDFMAMNLDDTIKLGARARIISGVVETKGDIPVELIQKHLADTSRPMGIIGILQHEVAGDRIRGFNDTSPSYNVSGSVVSVIDEARLCSPLRPFEDDYLVAIRGLPNPRSNGITDKRKIMVELFGEDWHLTDKGKYFLEFLAQPSTILYPIFKDLIDASLATSVYHMSGGAYNGKLARPIAKHDLFVEIPGPFQTLFQPDEKEVELMKALTTSVTDAYQKWPMGNDGFITTHNPDMAIELIRRHGLEARVVGQLQKDDKGRTGVELTSYNGVKIYFSGK